MRKWLGGVSFLAAVLFFQNCGQKFETDPAISNYTSSSCSTKLANQTFNILALNKSIDCKDLNFVLCDNSVFSPDQDNGQSTSTACDVSKNIPGCVRINSYFFNTRSAQKSMNREPTFAEGGSYNRTEFRCSLLDTRGAALLIEDGNDIPNALENLVRTCEEKKSAL